MKKLLLAFAILLAAVAGAQDGPPNGTYTKISTTGYNWLRGYFRALHLPAGDAPELKTGQWVGAGAVWLDTVENASPAGLYLYIDGIWQLQGTGTTTQLPDGLLAGGSVYQEAPGSFNFGVAAALYRINGVLYVSDSVSFVISAADATLNRSDLFYLGTDGAAHIREGVPAEAALVPQAFGDELALTSINIPAGATEPQLSSLIIYDENTESVVTTNTAGDVINGASAVQVFRGAVSTRWTNVNHADNAIFTKSGGGTWNIANMDGLTIYLYPLAQTPQLNNLYVGLYVNNVLVSTEVKVVYNKNAWNGWQGVTIPIAAFGNIQNLLIDRIIIRYLTTNPANPVHAGFDFDYIHFIDGLQQPGQPGNVSLTLNMPAAFTVSPSNTIQNSGSWNVTANGNNSQVIAGDGTLKTIETINEIGTFDSKTHVPNGATLAGDTIFFQSVTDTEPGMVTTELKARWDSIYTVENIGTGLPLMAQIDAARTGFYTLAAGSGVDIDTLDGNITISAGAAGSVSASEGLTEDAGDIQLGGTTVAPALLSISRRVDLNTKALYFTKGIIEIDSTNFHLRYTPFNIDLLDSISVLDPGYDLLPKHGFNFTRTIRYYPPGYRSQNRGGAKFTYQHQVGDSIVLWTDGGDYQYAFMAEQRFTPLTSHTGRSVIRIAPQTNGWLQPNQSPASVVANIFFDSTDVTKYIYLKGYVTGVRPYLVMANGATDTVENITYYSASSFVNTPSFVKRSYVYTSDATWNRTGQAWFLYDTTRRQKNYLAGNTAIGNGADTTDYKLDVRGAGRFSDSLTLLAATNTADTIGYDIVLRRRSDGTLTRVSAPDLLAFGDGGSGIDDVLAVGQSFTTSRSMNLNGFDFTRVSGTHNLFTQNRDNWTFNTTDNDEMLLTTMFAGEFNDGTEEGVRWNIGLTNGNAGTEGGFIMEAIAGRSRMDLFMDSINIRFNNGVTTIADSADFYFPVIHKTTGALSKTFWPVPGSGGGGGFVWGTGTGTLADQTDLNTALGTKLNHTTTSPAITGTTPSGTGVFFNTMWAELASNFALADNTTDQAAFSASLDTWPVQASTKYKFKILYHLNMGTANHTTSTGFTLGGGASVTSISYTIRSWNNAPNSGQTAQFFNYVNQTTATAASLFNTLANLTIEMEGTININAAGTITPFIKFSNAPGGTNEMVAGSRIELTPIGTNVQTSQGPVN